MPRTHIKTFFLPTFNKTKKLVTKHFVYLFTLNCLTNIQQ